MNAQKAKGRISKMQVSGNHKKLILGKGFMLHLLNALKHVDDLLDD